jgi:ribokinase
MVGGTFARHHGGKGANQAMAAARMGAAVTFVGAVGDDDFGKAALADLAGEGIDVSRISLLSGATTGVALIVLDERGENQIAVASGANAMLDARSVDSALGDFTPHGGVFLANLEIADDAILAGARFASQHGLQLLINPAPARELAEELLALRPILLPNRIEAESLAGQPDPVDAARVLATRTRGPVIVTLGDQGAVVVDADGLEHLAAPAVDVVDTTGAGDTFAGALAAELAAGRTLREAARVAVRAASMSVTAAGARGGMPYRASLD